MSTVDVRFYLALFARRLPLVIVSFAVCALLGVAVALLMPPVYRAGSRILVEAPQIESGIARDVSPASTIAQLQAIEQELISRTSILALAERFDIYKGRSMGSLDDIVDDMRSRIKLDEVQFAGVQGGTGATAFSVTFDARDPVLAADVANEIASNIVNRNVEMRAGRASDTLRFFDGEVARLGKELSGMEGRLLRFTNENREALPDSLDFRRQRQASQQERLIQLQREEAELRNRRSNLLKAAEASGRSPVSDAQSPKERQLAELQQLLEARRATFASSSPSVTSIEARMAALRNGDADAASLRPTSDFGLQLADIDSRLAYIGEERKIIGSDLADLANSIQATPNNAAALNTLNRDYDNVKAQYNAATSRRADASSVEQIELLSKGQKLTIVERASPPTNPAKPRRTLIVALAALGGVALGLGLIVLMEMANRKVRRPLDLVRTLGIQPFATIPYMPTPAEAMRRKLGAFAALACVVMVPFALWGVAERYPDEVGRLVGTVLGSPPTV